MRNGGEEKGEESQGKMQIGKYAEKQEEWKEGTVKQMKIKGSS